MTAILQTSDEGFCPRCFVGCVGTPSPWPTRQPPIWTLRKGKRRLECCLRSHAELGWEAQLYRDGQFYARRRFILHADAMVHAEEARGDCEREGWAVGEDSA
jgi:hypothetical protein